MPRVFRPSDLLDLVGFLDRIVEVLPGRRDPDRDHQAEECCDERVEQDSRGNGRDRRDGRLEDGDQVGRVARGEGQEGGVGRSEGGQPSLQRGQLGLLRRGPGRQR